MKRAMGIVIAILGILIVLLGIIFPLFSNQLLPALNRMTGWSFLTLASADKSTAVFQSCKEFYNQKYSPDYGYMEKFSGFFPETTDTKDRYRKLKYLCGGLLAIEETISEGGDLTKTLEGINEAYGTEIRASEIEEILESAEAIQVGSEDNFEMRQVWLAELELKLESEIDGVLS